MICAHEVEVGDRQDGLEFLSLPTVHDTLQDQGDALGDILVKELAKLLAVCLGGLSIHPPLPIGLVAEVFGVNKDHSTPRHSGRASILQITHLHHGT